jgi:hypothetical protein
VRKLREACALISERAASVRIATGAIDAYAAGLPLGGAPGTDGDEDRIALTEREQLAAHWLTLDAINFGSGWFPTLRKPGGRSGYRTIASGLRSRSEARGPWSAKELEQIDGRGLAPVLGQDPDHPLLGLFATSLRDLGAHVRRGHAGSFAAVADAAGGSAVTLALQLGSWTCYADSSRYDELEVPFLKRAQIAAADLARAGVAQFTDLDGLTMFADNLVAHVLRLDGILQFDPALVERIDRGELIEHGSSEEVEIRACAVHAVELIVAAHGGTCAADVDQLLWTRGQQTSYKALPRHRTRCTAY